MIRLTIVTPLAVAVDEDGIRAIRAEDDSGGFGILPGHADFLTGLSLSVVGWTRADGSRHYCAVRGGVLTVTDGRRVSIASREAIPGDDLATLDRTVLERFRAERDVERTEHVESTRLYLSAIRQIMRHLRPGGRAGDFA